VGLEWLQELLVLGPEDIPGVGDSAGELQLHANLLEELLVDDDPETATISHQLKQAENVELLVADNWQTADRGAVFFVEPAQLRHEGRFNGFIPRRRRMSVVVWHGGKIDVDGRWLAVWLRLLTLVRILASDHVISSSCGFSCAASTAMLPGFIKEITLLNESSFSDGQRDLNHQIDQFLVDLEPSRQPSALEAIVPVVEASERSVMQIEADFAQTSQAISALLEVERHSVLPPRLTKK
jgi:hypothetical protein